MIIEKQGFRPKGGKTQRAVETATEELLKGRNVVYITHELTPESICERIEKESEDVTLFNLLIYTVKADRVKEIVDFQDKEDVIIVDVGKDVSKELKDCDNDIYIYYQERSKAAKVGA